MTGGDEVTGQEAAEQIRTVRFTPVRGREGYDIGHVDDLLDRLEQAALAGEDLAPIVDAVVLDRVRLREGYSAEDVDAFLARLTGRPAPVTAAPAGDVIEAKRGLFERIFGCRKRGGSW